MRVIMLETRRGTEDGFTLRLYHENTEYLLAEGLARQFIQQGYARVLPPPDEE